MFKFMSPASWLLELMFISLAVLNIFLGINVNEWNLFTAGLDFGLAIMFPFTIWLATRD